MSHRMSLACRSLEVMTYSYTHTNEKTNLYFHWKAKVSICESEKYLSVENSVIKQPSICKEKILAQFLTVISFGYESDH